MQKHWVGALVTQTPTEVHGTGITCAGTAYDAGGTHGWVLFAHRPRGHAGLSHVDAELLFSQEPQAVERCKITGVPRWRCWCHRNMTVYSCSGTMENVSAHCRDSCPPGFKRANNDQAHPLSRSHESPARTPTPCQNKCGWCIRCTRERSPCVFVSFPC